jgi:hypothetical protein
VSVAVTDSLWNSIKKPDNHEVASFRTNESFFSFGETSAFENYKLLGTHMSDSGMTCIAAEHCYSLLDQEDEDCLQVDWDDFVLSTLSDPDMQSAPEDFPLYMFFSRIPEEDSAISVYGFRRESSEKVSGLILRAASMGSSTGV